jgi:hypothetical protein
VTKPSGPTGQMEMENCPTCTRDTWAIGSHGSDGPTGTCDTQAVGSHMSNGDGERSNRYTWHVSRRVPQVWCWRVPQVHVGRRKDQAETFMTNCKRNEWVTAGPTGTRRIDKDPTGTRCMEIWSRGDFYDELQASWMSNCRSHRYTLAR